MNKELNLVNGGRFGNAPSNPEARAKKIEKLRHEEWLKWVVRAFQSVYGYEYQGDNLLIGRINLLITFVDYMMDRWNEKPTDAELHKIANIISWNIWQMDGLTGMVPYGYQEATYQQMSLFDFLAVDEAKEKPKEAMFTAVRSWRRANAGSRWKRPSAAADMTGSLR